MRQILFLLILLFAKMPAKAQTVDSVYRLVDSALQVMETRSFYSRNINWKQLRDSVHHLAAEAQTYAAALPALAYAFDRLGDKHGWLVIGDSTHRNKHVDRSGANASTAAVKEVLSKGPQLYNGIIASRYAYVSIHFFMGQSEAEMNKYAQHIQDALCKNINSATKGIIIDLRLNGGGNTYPMYQGIVNVLGNRDFSEGVDGSGKITGTFSIQRQQVVLHGNNGDSLVLRLQRSCGDFKDYPVAVLIGPETASAAEQVAIAFSSRPRSVLVGERTAGYVTANNGFYLPGKGNAIVLAENVVRNRKGTLFTEAVHPDIEVVGGDDFRDREMDMKIRAAVQWLDAQTGKNR